MNILLRNIVHVLPNSIKYGRYYSETIKELRRTECMSQEEIKEYQFGKLKEILVYAYTHTRYYKTLFDSCGFEPSSFNEISEYRKIPLLTKEIIRSQANELISTEYPIDTLEKLSTSGSTGEPAVFYSLKKETAAKEAAFVNNAWKRIGYDGRGVSAVFRGEKIHVDTCRNVYWQEPTVYFKDVYSSYHINIDSSKYYIDHLIKRNTKWIMAFPSVLFELCQCSLLYGLSVKSVRGIFLSSEAIHGYQIDIIQKVFPNARFNLIYGHTERACFASSCDQSLYYHFQSEYGYTELLPLHDDIYEIVATGFNNHAMPLIRYATGDLISIKSKTKCSCNLPYDVYSNIGGRNQSYVVTKNGQKIVETAFIASVHSQAFDKLEKMQIEQFEKGKCIVRVKPITNISSADIHELETVLIERLNNDMTLQIQVVEDIPSGNNGKNKLIIQHLK